jgi:hypothetical protein
MPHIFPLYNEFILIRESKRKIDNKKPKDMKMLVKNFVKNRCVPVMQVEESQKMRNN